MPLLAAFLGNMIAGLAGWLAQYITKKATIVTASLAVLAVITAALFVTFNTLVSPLMANAFNTQYGQFLGLAFPPIAGTCMSTITAVWLACVAYKIKVQATRISTAAA